MSKHTSIDVLKKLSISSQGICDKTGNGILRYNNKWEYSNDGGKTYHTLTEVYPVTDFTKVNEAPGIYININTGETKLNYNNEIIDLSNTITAEVTNESDTVPSNLAVSTAITDAIKSIKLPEIKLNTEIYYNETISADSPSGLYINTTDKTFIYYNEGKTIDLSYTITSGLTADKESIPSNYAVSNAISGVINQIPALPVITESLNDSKESIPSNYAVSNAIDNKFNSIKIPEVLPEIYPVLDFDKVTPAASGLYIDINTGENKLFYNNNFIDLSIKTTNELTEDTNTVPTNFAVTQAIEYALNNIEIPDVQQTPEIYYNETINADSPSGLYITDTDTDGSAEFYTGSKTIKLSYEITDNLTNEVSTIPSNKAVYDAISGFSQIEKAGEVIDSPKNKTLYVTEESDCKVYINDEFINLSMEAVGDISNSEYQTDNYLPTVKAVVNYIASQVSNVSEPTEEIPAISNDGNPIIVLSESQITPTNLSIYKYETKENDTLTIDVTHLTADYSIEFQIWLDYKFACTFTNEIIWVNGELTDINKFYAIKFIWDGIKLIGQIQYSY